MRIPVFLAASFIAVSVQADDMFSSLSYLADGKLNLFTGFEYSSGDYGEKIDTQIWTVPLTLKYRNGPLTAKLSTSWLHVTGPGTVTPEGDPIPGSGKKTTEQGMGDVYATLAWNLLDERDHVMGMDVGAKVKFGTADEDKYLGTGENDYALQAEVFKPVGAWYPSIKLGYNWKGDPSGIDYRNVWYGSVGTDYRLSKTYSVGGYYDWRQKLTSGGNQIKELMVYFHTHINDSNKLNVYMLTGFTDSSPDWAAGLSLNHRF